MTLLLLLAAALAAAPGPTADPGAPPAEEWRRSPEARAVLAAPDPEAIRRGGLEAGAVFRVLGHEPGRTCADWGRLEAGGWLCLDGIPPAAPPTLGDAPDLPWFYAQRAPGAAGKVYADHAAWGAGRPAHEELRWGWAYAFTAREPTERVEIAVRVDGAVIPLAELQLYTPSAFAGRDLRAEPLDEGELLGWCLERTGCARGEGVFPYLSTFTLRIPQAWPSGRITTWTPPEPPPEPVAPGVAWVEVRLGPNTLTLVRDGAPELATLVAPGLGGRHRTPTGSFHVIDKHVANDMTSRPRAAEEYHVEKVPWVVHFYPRYALHGAYWHDRFGRRQSHGCVNLSPADAHHVFERLAPALPTGWSAIWPSEADPGALVVIR